jgi:methanogen homoaconitase small subunit
MLKNEADLRKYPFVEARPDFAPNVQPGDLIVAGKNFGCGSSREYAPLALKMVGIGAIIAPLFARIFFRNALNLGIPCFTADLTQTLTDGQEVELNLARGLITTADGNSIQLPEPPLFLREVWAEGGIVPFYRKHRRFPGESAGM